jgi:hypothetical protein
VYFRRGSLPCFILLTLVLSVLSPRAGFAEVLDITRPPDYRQLGTITGNERLVALRKTLGDVLAAQWKAASSGRPGSSAQENFASWVDLYQWIDLLESDETAVTKRWPSSSRESISRSTSRLFHRDSR